MKKTLFVFKTHFIEKYVVDEFIKLQNSLNAFEEALLFIDNHKCTLGQKFQNPINEIYLYNKPIKCFIFDENIFNKFKLPSYTDNPQNCLLENVMWYCSDYPYYILNYYLPEYDYYWNIEYDVYCNGNSYREFIDEYSKNKADFLASHYEKLTQNSDWHWKNNSDWIYKNKPLYKSFFPVTRLSSNAINFLYKQRLKHSEIFKNLTNYESNRWIFTELFVPTELSNNSFICEEIKNQYLRYMPVYNLNKERIFENPDYKLYHPVK